MTTRSAPGLAGAVGAQRCGHAVAEAGVGGEPRQLFGEICAQFVVGRDDLADELLAAIDQSDDVCEIAAAEVVIVPAPSKRVELCREEISRRRRADLAA